MHDRHQHQSQGINQQMTLAANDVFDFIEAALMAAYFRRLDALAINDGGTGQGLTSLLPPQTATQAVVNRLPNALRPPEAEVVINAVPLREIVRQHLPRDAAPHEIENTIEDFAHN